MKPTFEELQKELDEIKKLHEKIKKLVLKSTTRAIYHG